jgi:hypothetical protein
LRRLTADNQNSSGASTECPCHGGNALRSNRVRLDVSFCLTIQLFRLQNVERARSASALDTIDEDDRVAARLGEFVSEVQTPKADVEHADVVG